MLWEVHLPKQIQLYAKRRGVMKDPLYPRPTRLPNGIVIDKEFNLKTNPSYGRQVTADDICDGLAATSEDDRTKEFYDEFVDCIDSVIR
jgi:hypothetical protein